MIKEIKRKWNQHKCIPSPQNKDYWRNCWAFLELQATTTTIQTGAVLGYKISILVCLWTVCFVATNVRGKQSWWQRCSGWCSPPQDDGDWNPRAPGAAGMQQQWRLNPKPPNAAHSSSQGCVFKRWGPKAHWPEKPQAPPPLPAEPPWLVLCLVLVFTSWKVQCASLSHLLDNQISWLFKLKCCESQDDKLKEHTHKAMIIAGAMGTNLSCNVY